MKLNAFKLSKSLLWLRSQLLSILKLTALIVLIASTNVNAESSKSPITVKGKIIDEKGEVLQGATIQVKGTPALSTTSDVKGEFFLKNVPDDALIQISFVGYKLMEVPAKQNLGNIQLASANPALTEVVVVGYGVQKRATVTGSISQVKGDEVAKAPVSNIANALVGRLPGIQAVQSSGQPGADAPSYNIRGLGAALLILDGVPADFSQLDPAEVETITILKDASAAIYGVRAANGVVLVTTKKGKIGTPTISYTGYYGWQSLATPYPNLVNGAQFAQLYDEGIINGQIQNHQAIAPTYGQDMVNQLADPNNPKHIGTDWYGLLVRPSSPQQYHNLSVTGGTDKTQYFVSLGYFNQEGIWTPGNEDFHRYNLRSNITTKVADNLTFNLNLSGRQEFRYDPITTPQFIFGAIQRSNPLTDNPYANNNPDYLNNIPIQGNALALANPDISGYSAPVASIFLSSASLNYDVPFVKGLSAKAFYSYNYNDGTTRILRKDYNAYNYNGTTKAYVPTTLGLPANLTTGNDYNVQSDLQLSLHYENTIGKDHHLQVLGLFEKTSDFDQTVSANRPFVIDAVTQLNYGDPNKQTNSGTQYQTAYLSYVTRVNYDYKNKYLLEFIGREDGSYKFPPATRYGFFPAISAGWRMDQESWFSKSGFLSSFKLTASWGKLGDDASASGYQFYPGYNYSGNYVLNPGAATQGIAPGVLPNYTLSWYKSTTTNLAIEAGFLNDQFTLHAEVYNRNRSGLLASLLTALPGTFGATLPQQNLNSDNTRGFELQLGYNKHIGDLSLNISPNITFNRTRNEFLEQPAYTNALDNYNYNTSYRNQSYAFGYIATGQFQSASEIATSPVQDGKANQTLLPGDIKYKDLNHDGVINSSDETRIGKGTSPEIYYGLNLAASWKGFDIEALIQGATDYTFMQTQVFISPFLNSSSTYAYFEDRWHRQNVYDPNSQWVPGKYPSTQINGSINNNLPSTFWLTNVWYARLKSVNLGYTLNKNITSRIGVKKARIYVSGENLFTTTNLKNVDPEAPPGTFGQYYPQQKVVTVGLQAQF